MDAAAAPPEEPAQETGEENADEPILKTVQKLTGKITQKMREGAQELESKDYKYVVTSQNFNVNKQQVKTYKDHRMAMAFAPLALFGDIEIESAKVVDKSYPSYWEDLKIADFVMTK